MHLPISHRRGLAVGMLLSVGLTIGAVVLDLTRRQTLAQLARQEVAAVALARGLAVSSAVRVQARDQQGLQEIIDGVAGYPDLGYAMVLDATGQVLSHTDGRRRGARVAPWPQEGPLVLRGGAYGVEVLHPLQRDGRRVGWVGVALDGRTIQRERQQRAREGALYLLLALTLTALLARRCGAMLDQLQAREQEADACFDAAPDGILIVDADGRILRANAAVEELFGAPREALLGQCVDLLVPEHRAGMRDGLPRRETRDLDLRALRQDGRALPVSVNLGVVDVPEGVRAICVVRDMTRREQIETALRESLDRLETAASAGIVGIWDWDVVNDRLVWDAAMYKLYGRRAEDFGGAYEAWANAVHPDDRACAEGAIQAALRGERDYDPEFRVIWPDGSVRYLKAAARTFHDSECRAVRMVGVNYDLTELKRHERQLADQSAAASRLADELQSALRCAAESNQALQVTNKELESFSYSLSHDLRAPLRSVDGFSQILLSGYGERLDDQGRDLLQRMRAAAQRMSQLIDDMLLLSRISRAELRRERVDLSALAEAAVEQLREAFPERQVEVVIEPGIQTEADSNLARILLDNLLGNAWKFTGQTAAARVAFGAEHRDGQLECFVRDNGAGFDMAYADKLFGAFQRLHSTAEFPGSGIGLATVMRVVHKHGGQVRAEGAVGQGATFWFSLQP